MIPLTSVKYLGLRSDRKIRGRSHGGLDFQICHGHVFAIILTKRERVSKKGKLHSKITNFELIDVFFLP